MFKLFKIVIIGLMFVLISFPSKSQVIVEKKPEKKIVLYIQPPKPAENYFWVKGHWRWSIFKAKYMWVNGRWKKNKKGFDYKPGHWITFDDGYLWVRGKWVTKQEDNKEVEN